MMESKGFPVKSLISLKILAGKRYTEEIYPTKASSSFKVLSTPFLWLRS